MIARLRRHAREVATDFSQVERLLVFVGYPRSGHSLVGALVGAHPDALLSHELNLLSLHARGLSRLSLLKLIVARDREFASHGRKWEGYDYSIAGWSGEAQRPRVVGDKKGSGTTLVLERQPYALDRLEAAFQVPVCVLHVTRHPLDNIATIMRREQCRVEAAFNKYRARVETITRARAHWPRDQWLDLSYEALLEDVAGTLNSVLDWLRLSLHDEYLRACAATLFPSPNRSRSLVEWRNVDREVHRLIERHEFLLGYAS